METTIDVAIVGAGPYGLSLAANLQACGVGFRIFGTPMKIWRDHMPKGMSLKSEGFASNLHHPNSELTLGEYCRRKGIGYQDVGLPVSLDTFSSYGLAFQRKFVANLEQVNVDLIEGIDRRFRLQLSNSEVLWASKVVIATGITNFEYVPPKLRGLDGLVTHSSEHHNLSKFRGQEVTVLGAGASALDLAGLLHDAGASVQLFARRPEIRFHNPPAPRTLLDRVRAPQTGLGPGWRSWWCVNTPLLFHIAPDRFRIVVSRRHLGPAPGWFSRSKVEGKVPLHVGRTLQAVSHQTGRAHLSFTDPNGVECTNVADHVIAATGYRVNLDRLTFLKSDLRAVIRTAGGSPVLRMSFESSVPGLYFLGNAAAVSFGPMLRFVYGAAYASTRLARHLGSLREGIRVFGRSSPTPA
ncbi:MAG: NAD(P)-binding domain-containing protein [Bryobacteraceae bacterium]